MPDETLVNCPMCGQLAIQTNLAPPAPPSAESRVVPAKLDKCDDGQPCVQTTTGCWNGQCARRRWSDIFPQPVSAQGTEESSLLEKMEKAARRPVPYDGLQDKSQPQAAPVTERALKEAVVVKPTEPTKLPDLVVTRNGITVDDQKAGVEEFKRQALRRPVDEAQIDRNSLADEVESLKDNEPFRITNRARKLIVQVLRAPLPEPDTKEEVRRLIEAALELDDAITNSIVVEEEEDGSTIRESLDGDYLYIEESAVRKFRDALENLEALHPAEREGGTKT